MKLVISAEEDGILLSELLKKRLRLSTRAIKRLKYREEGLRVNGSRVTVRYMLHRGDVLNLDISDTDGSIIPSDLAVDVIYSDSCITIADKPPFMPTHPVHGHLDDTLANALAYRSGEENFVFRPLNRLDRNTSGIVVCSNDFVSSGRLSRQMTSGQVKKTYLAIVSGVPDPPSGRIDAPIERAGEGTLMRIVGENGESAMTDYRVLRVSGDGSMSLVKLMPLTGRTHQIRVHMAHIGCPLLGDFMYGRECDEIGRHALHACRMEFFHPLDGRKMIFCSALPRDMADVLEKF